MGLTKRQSEAIGQIIIEESHRAAASQRNRHSILSELDGDPIVEARPVQLSRGVQNAIQDLLESFSGNNRLYEGSEFDGGSARRLALQHLKRLIEADVKETQQMLQEGDFGMEDECSMGMDQGYDAEDDLDQMTMGGGSMPSGGMDQEDDVALPPMHPRGREERGGPKPAGGEVHRGAPPTGMRASLPEPKAGGGYPGGGDEEVDLPPMHPRGRR